MAKGGSARNESENVTVRPATIRATANAQPITVVTEWNEDTRPEHGTTVNSPLGHVSTSWNGQSATQIYEWPPLPGEANVLEALHRLRDTLNAWGRKWAGEVVVDRPDMDGWLVPVGSPRDEDGAPPPGAICCEVTRVERRSLATRAIYERLSRTDDEAGLVQDIVQAVESKDPKAHQDIVLVLDANDAPVFTERPDVVERAQATLDELQVGTLWAQIWLIGPTTTRQTHRLRQPSRYSSTHRIMASPRRRVASVISRVVALDRSEGSFPAT